MTTITEIAQDIYRLATYVPEADIQFGQFLVRDEEPLLFHTGPRGMFPVVRDAVAKLIDPADLRWVGFSHLESDECGSLNQWLELAPRATPVCSRVGAVVSIDDIAVRPARPMDQDDVLATGSLRFRFQQTPNVPHAWDAGLLFEETGRTLLCSDLFHQNGDVEALTEQDVVGRTRQMLVDYESNFLAGYQPYTPKTEPTLHRLAALEPAVLATMHGSVYTGDGAQALRDLAGMMRETLGGE